MEANIVVIGGGGSGLTAGLTAAEKGVKDIVVLEKRGIIGGNTALATGLFACESHIQDRDKIIADKDELFKKAMDWSHWSRINPRILRAFLNKSGDTIRWLEGLGLEFSVIAFFANQNPRVEHVPRGKGAKLIEVLADQCRKAGVKIYTKCAGTKILLNENNQVCGVKAKYENGYMEITTRVVIIATGGFSGNTDLLRKLCPLYYENMPLRGLPLTGDGITIAADVGAAIEEFATLLKEGPRVDKNNWPLGGLERQPFTLWVNKRGERFIDESIGEHPFESVNLILSQPDRVCFSLLDEAIKEKFKTRKLDLDTALQKEKKRNRVMISHSWEEIAAWIGTDPKLLTFTVEQYNASCDRGYDFLFAKARRFLHPLRIPPFYAIRGLPYLLDTLGGIKVNERMEVINTRGQPIPGLYAAGVITSGWESETYCSDLSGSAFGYAINSGRIAGENAAVFTQ